MVITRDEAMLQLAKWKENQTLLKVAYAPASDSFQVLIPVRVESLEGHVRLAHIAGSDAGYFTVDDSYVQTWHFHDMANIPAVSELAVDLESFRYRVLILAELGEDDRVAIYDSP